ncbi:response regulator [bacterium AH-315-L15]|nr:response regulator [bacterium AH-315-L15]
MKILIADDTEVNVKIVKHFCEQQGFHVLTSKNGAEAVDRFSSDTPDLVLMDVVMPVMDGYDATAKIKEISGDRWVPVILLTVLEDNEENLRKATAHKNRQALKKRLRLQKKHRNLLSPPRRRRKARPRPLKRKGRLWRRLRSESMSACSTN